MRGGSLLFFLAPADQRIEGRLDAPAETGQAGVDDEKDDKNAENNQQPDKAPIHNLILALRSLPAGVLSSIQDRVDIAVILLEFRDLLLFSFLAQLEPDNEGGGDQHDGQEGFEQIFHIRYPWIIFAKFIKKVKSW
jgi:hypothetical protein